LPKRKGVREKVSGTFSVDALGTKKAATKEGVLPTRPGAKATPSRLLARFTHSDVLKTPVDMVFIPADQQRQLEAWERNVAEGKTRGPLLVMVGSGYSGYNNIHLKVLETHLGKPDRTTKEQVKEIIGVAEGVAKLVPLDTRWYGPVGFTFVADSLVAVFYLPEKPDPDKKSFPAPAGTYKYRIKTDLAAITTEKGNLIPEYPTIKKEMERLIADASRFDLTKNRDLTEYGKYVGEQLKLAKGKAIAFEIEAESGKELFIGKLELGKSGEYEMTPSNKDPKPASSPQFDTPLGYYAGVGQITGRKVKSRALAGLTIVGEKTEAKYEYGETKAGPNEALVWVRFHTPKAVKNDVHFDQYSAVIDKKSYPVLASTSDLNAEFAEAIQKETTQHGADKSTYLLFAIPERATKFRLVYGDTGLDLAVPVPTIPEEVAPENATPNPTPGRDGVGVSLFDRTTGKVGDIPLATNQKLLEFSLTLDLSRAADREKLIQKWHELAGDKADRYTVTIWAAEKQYRWPHAGK
jgi:hypothetical protein